MSWRDVFDSTKLFPMMFADCCQKAKEVNYRFVAFNGLVYSVDDRGMSNAVCSVDDLK
jgi:hypothetical protein